MAIPRMPHSLGTQLTNVPFVWHRAQREAQWFTYRVIADFYEEQGASAVARCFRELKTLLKLELCLKVIVKLTAGRPSVTAQELASETDPLCGYTTVRSVLEACVREEHSAGVTACAANGSTR
jgi:hypothetical protein